MLNREVSDSASTRASPRNARIDPLVTRHEENLKGVRARMFTIGMETQRTISVPTSSACPRKRIEAGNE